MIEQLYDLRRLTIIAGEEGTEQEREEAVKVILDVTHGLRITPAKMHWPETWFCNDGTVPPCVCLEYPEHRVHPAVQVRLARAIACAVRTGSRYVVHTNSPHVLLGIQALVARGEIPHEYVALYWLRHTGGGSIPVVATCGYLDEAGRFGDWPEDWSDTELAAERAYLDAAEGVLAGVRPCQP